MFNSIYLYIILGLAASTASLGWLSVHNYRAKVEAESALVVAINVNTDMQKSLNLKDLSCKIDDASVVEVEAEKKDLQTKIEVVSDNIEKLRLGTSTSKPQAKQEIIKNESLKETNVLPDDGLLSSNLKALLKQSFCSVEPEDAYCLESISP